MNACKQCNKPTKNNKFCSRACAAIYNNTGRKHSAKTKMKISDSVKRAKYNPLSETIKTCPVCKKSFTTKNDNRCCSKKCAHTLTKNCFGVKKRSLSDGWKEWEYSKIVKKGCYFYAVVPEHPKSNDAGYVLEHRVVAENMIKRLLENDEVVHHIDGDKKNNIQQNLMVMTRSEHTRVHQSK